MCGIAGYFGTDEIHEARVKTCLDLMRHRGPDFAAYKHWKNEAGRNVYLLSTRLSIIDLDSRSNQPFGVASRWMVYNGELYNYVELRKELEDGGAVFRTQSDTEVLLTAIGQWGESALDRAEGMWAFAIYNQADGSLSLSRDRFGEKPLYIYRDSSGIYFGSEVKFIVALLGRKLEVNIEQVYRYLINGYKALYKSKNAFFKGLTELPPASTLAISAEGQESIGKYWQPQFAPDNSIDYEQAIKGTRERVIRSVELRLRADVPLAFCMSGGIDSNALISVAKKVLGYDVHGFTITNLDERYDEEDLVKHAVAELGLRHTSVPADTADFLAKLKTLVRQHDAPVFTITYFAHWLLMQSMAAQKYHISVSGTAADELFSGYYDHYLAHLAGVKNNADIYPSALAAWIEHVKPIVRNPFLGDPDLFTKNPNFRDHIFLDAPEFAKYLIHPWSKKFSEETFTPDLLRNRMLNEMFRETIPVILHEDDLNAMYYSIENRSPFLDRHLFEFCYSIPSKFLIRDGFNKAVLRDAMRGIVPEKILSNRRKVGFNASIYSFLDVKNSEVRSYLLGPNPIYDHVRRDKIEELIAKPDLPNSESKFLFYFLSAKMFLEKFA